MDGPRRVWLYNFKLHISASEVYVVASYNDWSRNQKMVQISEGVFEKEVILPDLEKIYYAFDVDGDLMIDPSSMQEVDLTGKRRNVIVKEQKGATGTLQALSISSPYRYKRLDFDTHEIRIITLSLSRNLGLISCSMAHVSLLNPGPYNALSYCWGDSRKSQRILLDGIVVPITENLYFALSNVIALATREAHSASYKLWVDALCINQADSEERSSQVRNMRQIYSRAGRVIAAIGEPERLACDWKTHYFPDSVAYLIGKRYNGQITVHNQHNPTRLWELNGWSILQKFFNEPYWTRVWIIQELTVATKVVMLCADVEIKWEDLAAILMMWKSATEPHVPQCKAYRRALHLLEFRERFSVTREPIRLLDALRWSHSTQATDPRDKIFGLLGLCYDWQTYVPLPNYEQPLEVIMADMAKSMMRMNRSLELICFKGPNFCKSNTSPTWLPNFFNLGHESVSPIERRILAHSITCDRNPIVEELEDLCLVVKSIPIATISNISTAMKPYDEEDVSKSYGRAWISEILDLTKPNYGLANLTAREEEMYEDILRSLTMSVATQNLSDETARYYFSILWTPMGRGAIHNIDLIRWIDRNAWLKLGPWTLREWSRMGYTNSVPLPQISATDFDIFVKSFEQVLGSGIRLCESKTVRTNFRFVSLVHPDAELSDQIHCIQGCSFPVILRQNSELNDNTSYRVIGGTYVNDWEGTHFMDFIKGGKAPPKATPRNIVLM